MPRLSTARQSLARLDARIAAESDARRKAWLTTYRNHWWGEVVGDVDMVMDTMSHGPISYTFDGHPFMSADDSLARITDRAGTRAMYEGVVALGVRMAGPFDTPYSRIRLWRASECPCRTRPAAEGKFSWEQCR